MINKRLRAGLRKMRKDDCRIGFSFGTIALITVCIVLLIIATFSQIQINFNIPENSMHTYLKFEYIPQIPIILFIAALLGECWALIVVLLYILMGLTSIFPVFALGGGLSYIFQYNFGYIFAYIFAVLITAKKLRNKPSILDFLIAVLYGVFTIHIIGIVYMTIISFLRHDSLDFITNWIYFQSISKILYDIVFGFIAVLLARGIRKILWVLLA